MPGNTASIEIKVVFENSADKLVISFPRTFNLADSTNIDVISKGINVDVGENVQRNNVYIGNGSSQISKSMFCKLMNLFAKRSGRHGPVKLYLSADTDIFNAVSGHSRIVYRYSRYF